MVTQEPQISDTGRYSVLEASNLLGVHRDTLRRYTEKGYIKFGLRRCNGRKFYLGSEIKKLWKKMY